MWTLIRRLLHQCPTNTARSPKPAPVTRRTARKMPVSRRAFETRCPRSSKAMTGLWCRCLCRAAGLWKTSLMWRDPWTRLWCGRRRRGGSSRISIHISTTPSSARPSASYGGTWTSRRSHFTWHRVADIMHSKGVLLITNSFNGSWMHGKHFFSYMLYY